MDLVKSGSARTSLDNRKEPQMMMLPSVRARSAPALFTFLFAVLVACAGNRFSWECSDKVKDGMTQEEVIDLCFDELHYNCNTCKVTDVPRTVQVIQSITASA